MNKGSYIAINQSSPTKISDIIPAEYAKIQPTDPKDRYFFPHHHSNRRNVGFDMLLTVADLPKEIISFIKSNFQYPTLINKKAIREVLSEDEKKAFDLKMALCMIDDWIDPTNSNKYHIYYHLSFIDELLTKATYNPFEIFWNGYRYKYHQVDWKMCWSRIRTNPSLKCMINFVLRNMARRFPGFQYR